MKHGESSGSHSYWHFVPEFRVSQGTALINDKSIGQDWHRIPFDETFPVKMIREIKHYIHLDFDAAKAIEHAFWSVYRTKVTYLETRIVRYRFEIKHTDAFGGVFESQEHDALGHYEKYYRNTSPPDPKQKVESDPQSRS